MTVQFNPHPTVDATSPPQKIPLRTLQQQFSSWYRFLDHPLCEHNLLPLISAWVPIGIYPVIADMKISDTSKEAENIKEQCRNIFLKSIKGNIDNAYILMKHEKDIVWLDHML